MPTIAVIASGAMGSGIGARLVERGATVLTSLTGRSEASAARARAAGMQHADDSAIAEADFVLSVIPPGEAATLAERFAPALKAAGGKAIFADLNAISPATASQVETIIARTGTPFVDGGIIGGPPAPGKKGPAIYISGPEGRRLAALVPFGLDIRVMDEAVGAASALKMSYAGITKGFTALGSIMALAATRGGVAEALRRELSESQPALFAVLSRSVPGMYGKAYRWIAEMEEIAAFIGEEEAGRAAFSAIARFYEAMAADAAGPRREIATLSAVFGNGEASSR